GGAGFRVNGQGVGGFPLGPEGGGLLRRKDIAGQCQGEKEGGFFHIPRLDLRASISDFSSRTCSLRAVISSSISVRQVATGTADSADPARGATTSTAAGATS